VLVGLFTGMREGEVSALQWAEVDLTDKMLRLPAARMKAKKPFDLPMTDLVHQILVTRRAIGREGDFVFPGHGKSGHCESFSYALSQIEETTGITTSPHDMRRTFASIAATCEIPPVALKMLIAHSAGSDVTFGYVQLSLPDFRKAAQKVADRFKELCGIAKPGGENVVQIA
jgi:integrase